MTLYEKILEIMKEVQYLAKDTKVEYKNTKYKALSEEKVTSIMREQMIKHKIVVYPIAQMFTRYEQEDSTNAISHVDVTYRMVNAEDPKDYIDIVSAGDGADTQDKGSGKAMTYAYKYMWLRAFGIPTGEDPDRISSEELNEKAKATTAIPEPKEDVRKATPKQIEVLKKVYKGDTLKKLLTVNQINTLEDLPLTKASELIDKLKALTAEMKDQVYPEDYDNEMLNG